MGARRLSNRFYLTIMKNYKLPIIRAVVIPIGLIIFWLAGTSHAATETPDYKLIRIDGRVEIRDYPALTIATTTMEGAGMNGGFRQLFKFITGKNEGEEKIAMTSPVLIHTAKEKKTMSFIMPKSAVEKGVPQPTGENVRLGKVEAARFVVLRFDGGRTAENEAKTIEKLKTWLKAQKIQAKSEPIFGYYDPPWTPTFLRRNEVMIRIDKHHE